MSSPYREGPSAVTLRSLVIPRFFLHQCFCVLSGMCGALLIAGIGAIAQGCRSPDPPTGCAEKFFTNTSGSFQCDSDQYVVQMANGFVCRCPKTETGAIPADAAVDE